VFGQNVVTLDAALKEAANYFYEIIPPRSVIAILDFEAANRQDAVRIVEDLTALMVNDRILTLVDRGRLAKLIEQEKSHQMSGRVDDNAQVRIGHELGAHSIISGTLTNAEGGYRMRMQSIDVLTGGISGVWTRTVSLADEGWKRKRFYIGAGAGFGFPLFKDAADGFLPGYASRDFTSLYSFEGEIRVSYSFTGFFALQTGLIFGVDSFEVFNPRTNHYLTTISYRSVLLPLMAKVIYRPGIFQLQASAGAYLSFPLGQMSIEDGKNSVKADFSPPFGFITGLGAGIKAGPGVLLIEGRYLYDLAPVSVKNNGLGGNTELDLGQRQKFSVWLGYDFGF
ncbi:MAG: outer membrane beta-barrel protein, partial [Treponema sp.]|nr:outer membrane beta-barrel protein [Treponema sp.]